MFFNFYPNFFLFFFFLIFPPLQLIGGKEKLTGGSLAVNIHKNLTDLSQCWSGVFSGVRRWIPVNNNSKRVAWGNVLFNQMTA